MTCPHCGGSDWYELGDGRSRCHRCYATVSAPAEAVKREEGVEVAAEPRTYEEPKQRSGITEEPKWRKHAK